VKPRLLERVLLFNNPQSFSIRVESRTQKGSVSLSKGEKRYMRALVLRSFISAKFKTSIFAFLAFISTNVGYCAEFYITTLSPDTLSMDSIVIEGGIVKGDYEKFLGALYLSYNRNSSGPSDVCMYTLGGDAIEAMKIGRIIRKLRLSTSAPSFNSLHEIVCYEHVPWGLPKNNENCNCVSSGFLMWASGIIRYGTALGVHRSFINHEILKDMPEEEAVNYSKLIKSKTGAYLKELGIGESLLEMIDTIPSTEVEYIPNNYYVKFLEGTIPDYQEWVLAKCGDEDEARRRVNVFNATHDLNHLSNKAKAELDALLEVDFEISKCKAGVLKTIRTEAYNKEFFNAITEIKPSYLTFDEYLKTFNTKLVFPIEVNSSKPRATHIK